MPGNTPLVRNSSSGDTEARVASKSPLLHASRRRLTSSTFSRDIAAEYLAARRPSLVRAPGAVQADRGGYPERPRDRRGWRACLWVTVADRDRVHAEKNVVARPLQ